MTGGMAFVYDPEDVFTLKVNPETVSLAADRSSALGGGAEGAWSRSMSPRPSRRSGARLLNDWNREVEHFWQVVPKEMLSRLPQPLTTEQAAKPSCVLSVGRTQQDDSVRR